MKCSRRLVGVLARLVGRTEQIFRTEARARSQDTIRFCPNNRPSRELVSFFDT